MSTETATIDETAGLGLENFLPYRLSLLTHLISIGIAQIYTDRFGLSAAQWRVLAAVAERPGIAAREVVEMTPMDKVKVSRAVAALCDMDLLARRASRSDGRVALLSLTSRGRRIFGDIAPLALEFAERLQEDWSAEERAQFQALTERLLERSREMLGG